MVVLFVFRFHTIFLPFSSTKYFVFLRILDFGYTFIATPFSTFIYNLSITPNNSIQNTILNGTVHHLLVYKPKYNLYALFTLTPLSYLSLLYSYTWYSSIFEYFRLLSLKYKIVSLLVDFEPCQKVISLTSFLTLEV